MSLSKKDVEKVLTLSHLEIPESEKAHYLEQLQKVLEDMDRLQTLDLSVVENALLTESGSTPERADQPVITDNELISKNAPDWDSHCFVVPRIA